MAEYTFHFDAGHGWLEVDKKELTDLGIVNAISNYSYKKDGKVYLEEDCDASLFIQKLEEATRQTFKAKEVDDGDRSPIRQYQRYWPI